MHSRFRFFERSVSSGPNRRKWTGASKIEVDLGDTVISVTVSDDETMFAAGGASKKAHVFSTADGRELACFACAQPINSLLFCDIHPRRAYLLAGTFGGIINAFDVSAGRDAALAEEALEIVLIADLGACFDEVSVKW